MPAKQTCAWPEQCRSTKMFTIADGDKVFQESTSFEFGSRDASIDTTWDESLADLDQSCVEGNSIFSVCEVTYSQPKLRSVKTPNNPCAPSSETSDMCVPPIPPKEYKKEETGMARND